MYSHDIDESDYLMLSGIQHYAFCPRQWAIIHVENQWSENYRTVDGMLMHKRTHDAAQSERRGSILILRDLRVFSRNMGVSGACDVVEFVLDANGVSLHGYEGLWMPCIVEYKRGKPKDNNADELQLCAQAMCLEEMLCCGISQGSLFYGETRRRVTVDFSQELRESVEKMFVQMHEYMRRGYTPKVKPKKGCKSCSLMDACLPVLCNRHSARQWLDQHLQDEVSYEEDA